MARTPRTPRDSGDLFRRIEPPSGGLQRLRARLEAEPGRRRTRRVWAGAAAAVVAAAAVAAVVWVRPAPPPEAPSPAPVAVSEDAGRAVLAELARDTLAEPTLAALGLSAAPDAPVVVPVEERGSVAVLRVPVDDDRVVMYWIAELE